jgi:hypothetical protein
MIDDTDLKRRALAAYFRTGGTGQPDGSPALVEVDGKQYAVLGNGDTVLAVYRVRAYDGVLQRLKRWPASIGASA